MFKSLPNSKKTLKMAADFFKLNTYVGKFRPIWVTLITRQFYGKLDPMKTSRKKVA